MSKRVAIVAIVLAIAGVVVWRCRGGDPAVIDAAIPQPPLSKARLKLRDLQRQKAGSIRGTVTANGPIPNALVCSRPTDDLDDIRCDATDATGRYELADLRPRAYQLWASADGFAGVRRPDKLTLKAGESKDGIDFVLPRGTAEISGVVRDIHARVIANAFVHVRVDGEPIATAHVDQVGAFRVRIAGTEATLEAEADGFVNASTAVAAPASGIELTMLPEATLSGIVVEAGTKTPVADAKIWLDGVRLTSNDDGTFKATKLRPGRYKPTASSIGGYGEATESVLLRVGAHVENVVIEVHPVAVVAGRIVIEGTDKGCPEGDGSVMLDRRGSRELALGKTVLDGDVLIEGVVPGIYAVRLQCTGFNAKTSYPDLVVGGTDVEDVVWAVRTGGSLAGRVRTKSGDPVNDAAVTINAGFGNGARVRTAADGTFEASGLPAGEVSVEAIQTGYAQSAEVKATISLTSVARVDLVLGDKTGEIVGTVVDRVGKPVVGARVEARPAGPSDTTNVHGEFELHGLDPGFYNVVVESKWQSKLSDRTTGAAVRTRVDRGVTARVQLQIEPDANRITGTVSDGHGPLGDVAIDIALTGPDIEPRRRSWERAMAWSSASGGFEITGLPDQPVAVRARIEGANETVVDNVKPGDHVRLVLSPTGVLSGVVTDPSGASVDDITLEIEDRAQDISRRERLFHTGGKFTFRELPAGTYRLTADEDRQTSITVTLANGEQRDNLQLALRPRHSIKGRLVDTAGKPLPNYKLEFPHKESIEHTSKGGIVVTYESEFAATDARGEFLIEGLVGSEVIISAGSLDGGPDPKMTEIKTVPLTGPPVIDVGDLVMRSENQ